MSDAIQNVRIVKFTGKISWEGQENGLPPEIAAYVFYDARLPAQKVMEMIDTQFAIYHRLGGMSVEKDQGDIIDMRRTIIDRIFVPYKWIVHVHPEIVPIPGDTPMADETGVERLSDGRPALKQ